MLAERLCAVRWLCAAHWLAPWLSVHVTLRVVHAVRSAARRTLVLHHRQIPREEGTAAGWMQWLAGWLTCKTIATAWLLAVASGWAASG